MSSFKHNKQPINIRKSPIAKLKEDLENLRQKNAEDKFIIKKQNDEIEELKRLVEARKRTPSLPAADNNRLLQLQAEVERELLEKRHLQHRLHVISSEKEKLNSLLLENKKFTQQMEQLQREIKADQEAFIVKEQYYQALMKEKQLAIEQQKLKREELIKIHQLELDHQNTLRENTNNNKPKKTMKKPELKLDELIEQALKEFEQEQHNHPPSLRPSQFFTDFFNAPKLLRPNNKHTANQQWYSQKYTPVDAVSWPKPEILPNLKKAATISAFTL